MKILVIDDLDRNIAAAYATLIGHEVTTVDNIKEAFSLLRNFGAKKFDAVLTDLFLPLGDFNGSFSVSYSEKSQENWKNRLAELPAGLVFALASANVGVKTVICTDADHHEDYICSLLDMIKIPYRQRFLGEEVSDHHIAYVEARNATMEAHWDEESKELKPSDRPDYTNLVKDWNKAMIESRLFPELERPDQP